LGLIATACHWLDERTATARFADDLDLLAPLVFSDTGALLFREFALCNIANNPSNSDL